MTKTITNLEIQKRNKERVNVFLDGEFALAVSIFAAAGLYKGQTLTEAAITALKADDEQHTAYQRALRFLGPRPRSRAEVESYLREKEYPAPVIATTVERLQEQRYLDDEAFAHYWRDNRERFRPRGARALRYELRQKGVDKQVIDEALTGLDEDAAAWAALAPKLNQWQRLDQPAFTQKVMGLLARRGFGYDIARRTARRAWTELGGRDTLDE
jgi:regulatory protein